jgi:hypothetical protein
MFTRKSASRNCLQAHHARERREVGRWLGTYSIMMTPENLVEDEIEIQEIIESICEHSGKEEIEYE